MLVISSQITSNYQLLNFINQYYYLIMCILYLIKCVNEMPTSPKFVNDL